MNLLSVRLVEVVMQIFCSFRLSSGPPPCHSSLILFLKCLTLATFGQNIVSLILTQYVCLNVQLNLEWFGSLEMEYTHSVF